MGWCVQPAVTPGAQCPRVWPVVSLGCSVSTCLRVRPAVSPGHSVSTCLCVRPAVSGFWSEDSRGPAPETPAGQRQNAGTASPRRPWRTESHRRASDPAGDSECVSLIAEALSLVKHTLLCRLCQNGDSDTQSLGRGRGGDRLSDPSDWTDLGAFSVGKSDVLPQAGGLDDPTAALECGETRGEGRKEAKRAARRGAALRGSGGRPRAPSSATGKFTSSPPGCLLGCVFARLCSGQKGRRGLSVSRECPRAPSSSSQ